MPKLPLLKVEITDDRENKGNDKLEHKDKRKWTVPQGSRVRTNLPQANKQTGSKKLHGLQLNDNNLHTVMNYWVSLNDYGVHYRVSFRTNLNFVNFRCSPNPCTMNVMICIGQPQLATTLKIEKIEKYSLFHLILDFSVSIFHFHMQISFSISLLQIMGYILPPFATNPRCGLPLFYSVIKFCVVYIMMFYMTNYVLFF